MATTNKRAFDVNISSYIEINQEELSISCPISSMTLWNMHPKVYLSFGDSGEANCPYCGTNYKINKADKNKVNKVKTKSKSKRKEKDGK